MMLIFSRYLTARPKGAEGVISSCWTCTKVQQPQFPSFFQYLYTTFSIDKLNIPNIFSMNF